MTKLEFLQACELQGEIEAVTDKAQILVMSITDHCDQSQLPGLEALKAELILAVQKWEATQLEPLNNNFANL